MEVFPALLFSWDSTNIPVNLSCYASLCDIYGTNNEKEHLNLFNIWVAE